MPAAAPPAIAKITRPRPRRALQRARLHERLSAEPAPVIWIAAPPGAGKTTLAAAYSQTLREAVLWYRVDAGDTDPAAFFHDLARAAQRAGLPAAQRLPSLAPESGADPGPFARRFFRTLFERLPRGLLVVLDNVQEADSPAFWSLLREAFEGLPTGARILVLAHADPPAALSRGLANGQIALVDATELRFTREESDAVVLARLEADAGLLEGLHRASAGWAAGLVLMVDRLVQAAHAQGDVAKAPGLPAVETSRSAVFGYFASEVFDRCSAAEQHALLLAAALPHVNVSIASAIGVRETLLPALAELQRRHLFVERDPGRDGAYRCHPLFSAFLRERAAADLTSQVRRQAAQRAAAQLHADGQTDAAIVLLLAAGYDDGALPLILQRAPELMQRGRWRTLLDWIAALHDPKPGHEASLAYWRGACQVWTQPALASESLRAAHRGFVAAGDIEGAVRAAGALTRACILQPDWSLLDPWIAELDRLLALPGLPSLALVHGLGRLVYAAFARNPGDPRIGDWVSRLLAEIDAQALPSGEALAAGYGALFVLAWGGQTDAAERLVRRVDALVNDPQDSPAPITGVVHWCWVQAHLLRQVGTPEQALAMLERALELAQAHGMAIAGVIRRFRIAHLLTLSRLDEAREQIEQLPATPRVEPDLELRGWLAWRQGRMTHALADVRAALQQARERGRGFYVMLGEILLAMIATSAGLLEEARAALVRYRDFTHTMVGEMGVFQAGLVEAAIALRAGDAAAAGRALGQALQAAQRQRVVTGWGWHPDFVTPLLEEALRQGIAPGPVHHIIRTHRLAPSAPLVVDWPWPVRIATLGRFEVRTDGEPLRFEHKAQRKPLDLLALLCANAAPSMPIDEVIDQLWPDPDKGGRKALDVTVHRLRKLLGHDASVQVADRHVGLDRRFVWVDAWALEHLLEPLTMPGIEADPRALAAAAPAVLALCRGPFLAGVGESAAVLAARRRYAGRLERFAEQLGAYWEGQGERLRALTLYQRITEVDPLAESFYRRQMSVLEAEGRRAEALDVYAHCRRLLALKLGAAPAAETERIARRLAADSNR